MTGRIRLLFGIGVFTANLMVFVVGWWLLFHSLRHLGEPVEIQSTLTIEHIGSVAGAPHLIGVVMGCALILMSMLHSYKIYRATPAVKTPKKKSRLHFSKTTSGRLIAMLKNHASLER